MQKPLLFLILSFLIFSCEQSTPPSSSLLPYVDPLTGTGNSTTISALKHGHGTENLAQTIPNVSPPFAMTNWTPQTRRSEKKCLAPYYYKDSLFQGFRGTHWLSGSCVQDYGSMTITPVVGGAQFDPSGMNIPFSHNDEVTTPAYYSLKLPEAGIQSELTSTTRCGFMQFTFTGQEQSFIALAPNSDEKQGFIQVDIENREIMGYNPVHRIYQGWGEPAGFSGYFVAKFEQAFDQVGVFDSSGVFNDELSIQNTKDLGAFVKFALTDNQTIRVKIGTSFTSIKAARNNLETEIPHWDFARTRKELTTTWETALGKIEVKGPDENEKKKFYTALYHTMQQPRVFSDVDGSYVQFANSTILKTDGHTYYTDFSTWDTYRALHPLINILDPERSADMMKSLVLMAEQGEWLPIFPCWNSYTAAMIGDHLVSVMGDAYVKGIRDFDIEKAYQYMRQNAFELPEDYQDYVNGQGRRALDSYMQYGYIPMEEPVKEAFHKNEQVSRTLEYAYDDYVLAQLAKALGKESDFEVLDQRTQNYQKVYDPAVGYMRGRNADGSWHPEFDKSKKLIYITEGTPRHYSYYVPHDVEGLIELMGGNEVFTQKLDSLFQDNDYWHGNEPSHHIAYLFNYAGHPEKTQQYVRQVMAEEYSIGPGGLSGNDDSGQMSAWYVFSAMGFYPVCPGKPEYALGSPVFEEIRIHSGGGTIFTIVAKDNSPENTFVRQQELDGKNLNTPILNHESILQGSTLLLQMGS